MLMYSNQHHQQINGTDRKRDVDTKNEKEMGIYPNIIEMVVTHYVSSHLKASPYYAAADLTMVALLLLTTKLQEQQQNVNM